MKMSKDFISGFASAVANLGGEGDHRGVDWSAPFEYLKSRLNTFEPIGGDIVERLRQRGDMGYEAAYVIERLRKTLSEIETDDRNGKWGRWAREALLSTNGPT